MQLSTFHEPQCKGAGKREADFSVLECQTQHHVTATRNTLQVRHAAFLCREPWRSFCGHSTPEFRQAPLTCSVTQGPGGRPLGTGRQSRPGGGELSGQCLVLPLRLQGRGGGRPAGGTAAGLASRPPSSWPPCCLPLPGVTSPAKTDLEKSPRSSRLTTVCHAKACVVAVRRQQCPPHPPRGDGRE